MDNLVCLVTIDTFLNVLQSVCQLLCGGLDTVLLLLAVFVLLNDIVLAKKKVEHTIVYSSSYVLLSDRVNFPFNEFIKFCERH